MQTFKFIYFFKLKKEFKDNLEVIGTINKEHTLELKMNKKY